MNGPHRLNLAHGQGSLQFTLPEGWDVTVAAPPDLPPVADLSTAVSHALNHPVGASPGLRELARPGAKVTVVITDATRPCPDAELLPGLLGELEAAGVSRKDVTILVALGMHRRATEPELRAKLGGLFGSIRVEQAQGGEIEAYRELPLLAEGELEDGIAAEGWPGIPPVPVPLHLHHRVLECDLLIATGVVEPHQYAGFSGARKSVAIGCAGQPTIRALHSIPFLEHPGTRLGRLDRNPLHATLEEIATRARLAFVLNLALDPQGRAVAVAAGPPRPVLDHLTEVLARTAWAEVGIEPFDVALVGVGSPKDSNLYQASRALTYLAFTPRPAVREGGWIAICAACPEGAGEGTGEKEFLQGMGRGKDPEAVLEALRRSGFGAGGQRAFMVARALQRHRGMVIGSLTPEVVTACHMRAEPSPQGAIETLRAHIGGQARVLVVPHGLATLAVLARDEIGPGPSPQDPI